MALRDWLAIPATLKKHTRRLDRIMATTERVKVATDALRKQTAATAAGVNALLTSNANLEKALEDLRANELVPNEILADLEAAITDNGKVADSLKSVVDPTQPTPPVEEVPVVTPAPGVDEPETVPVPGDTDTPALPIPDGAGSTEPVTPADDASGAAVTPGTVTPEPTEVAPAEGHIDNSDGHLTDPEDPANEPKAPADEAPKEADPIV